MLKIYSDTHAGQREAEIHRKAYAAISEDSELEARVPELNYCDEVTLAKEELKSRLESQGVGVSLDGSVEVILMDFIEGDDFATYLYREIAKRHPKLERLHEVFEQGTIMPYNQIVDQIGEALGSDTSNGDILYAFHKAVADYLYKEGFTLDRDFLSSLKQATATLHNNKIFHNDLHERNVMMEETEQGMRPVIIDFGRSTGDIPETILERREAGMLDDGYLVNAYTKLTFSPEERKKREQSAMFGSASRDLGKKHAEAYDKLLREVEALLISGADESVLGDTITKVDAFLAEAIRMNPYSNTEHFWNTKAFLLNDLAERHPSIREALREYIDGIIKADRAISASTPAQNMLKRFKKSLE